MRTILSAVVAGYLLLTGSYVSAQAALEERAINLKIDSETLAGALDQWAAQTGVQLISPSWEVARKITATPLKGSYTARAALEMLLSGTPLTGEWKTAKAVAIRERSSATPAAAAKDARSDSRGRPSPNGTRLASGDAIQERQSVTRSRETDGEDSPAEPLEKVIVTGTNIRGNTDSRVLTVTAQDIADTGYATMQDWANTLPQNFGSIPNEENGGTGNFNRGTGINLRGLGAGATLTLVNGRRQPASGTEGDFVDISTIPVSAIARVEVLTDGASAIYGSDAIGGVVNIVLRDDFQGAQTMARYATASDGLAEKTVAQLLGTSWETGHVLLTYQFYDRDSLPYADRGFAATADKRPQGGDDFRSTNSSPGNVQSLLPGRPNYAVPANQDGTNLAPSDLLAGVTNLQNQNQGADILPERTMHSGFLTASQALTDNLSLFVEGRYSKRTAAFRLSGEGLPLFVPASNGYFVDPFGGSAFLLVGYNFINDFGNPIGEGDTRTAQAAAGIELDLPGSWKATGSASKGEERLEFDAPQINQTALTAALADRNRATAFNPFGDGADTSPQTLAAIRTFQHEKSKSEIATFSVLAEGPLFSMGGGDARIAVGADRRAEDLHRGIVNPLHLDRDVTAGYVEALLPFVSEANSKVALQKLQLSMAGRYEQYSDFGSAFNPKVGLRFAPTSNFQLHGSWGTSFRAPTLVDLDSSSSSRNSSGLVSFTDPQSPTRRSTVLVRFGGNQDLEEETADTWSTGLEFELTPLTSIGATYYDIRYEDRVVQPGPIATGNVLLEESLWGEIIKRSPSRADVDAICNEPNFRGTRATCLASSPAAIIDFRKRNIAETQIRGVDLLVDTRMPTAIGEFGLNVNATYVLDYETRVSDASQSLDRVDTVGNPLAFRLRAGANWTRGNYNANISWNHVGSYRDASVVARRSVDAWDTIDTRLSYRRPNGSSFLDGIELALSAANVFDEDPPFVNTAVGYDELNASALGRFVSFQVSKTWGRGGL